MVQVSRKRFGLKKIKLKKLPVSKIESLLKSGFNLNQMCEIVVIDNCEIWNFNATWVLYIFVKYRKKALKL